MFDGKNLRKKLKAGEICLGTWTSSSDPCEAELLCGSGFDFLIIDSEHGALTIESVQQDIMATKGSDVLRAELLKNSLGEGCCAVK